MSQGSEKCSVSRASRNIHSVCGVAGGMFVPVTSVEKAKTSLSPASRKRFPLRPRKTILRKVTFAVFKWYNLLLRADGYRENDDSVQAQVKASFAVAERGGRPCQTETNRNLSSTRSDCHDRTRACIWPTAAATLTIQGLASCSTPCEMPLESKQQRCPQKPKSIRLLRQPPLRRSRANLSRLRGEASQLKHSAPRHGSEGVKIANRPLQLTTRNIVVALGVVGMIRCCHLSRSMASSAVSPG